MRDAMTIKHRTTLECCKAWAETLPPYSRVWIDRAIWKRLYAEVIQDFRITPAVVDPPRAVRIFDVIVLPKK